ncbi:MAG: hypothetical protein JWN74_1267 [Acidobacteriaceae bacterium]|nr:hypothetical protein [Acidobacteriaceae bacterium]
MLPRCQASKRSVAPQTTITNKPMSGTYAQRSAMAWSPTWISVNIGVAEDQTDFPKPGEQLLWPLWRSG